MSKAGDQTRRTLAAMIMADVVGYSRLMAADEADTVSRLKDMQAACIRPVVARYKGRLLDAVGDSMFIEFASVVDATHAAIALQQAVSSRNATAPEGRRIVYRMGINIGDVIVRDGTLFGDSVNIAARVQTLAEPGGICLSGAAMDQVRTHVAAAFEPLGTHTVKNIARPIEVFSLPAAAIAGVAMPEPRPDARPLRRIAIAAAAVVLLAGAGLAGAELWTRQARSRFTADLGAVLAATQASLDARARANLVEQYVAIGEHRAMAVAPRAQNRWWTGNWPSAAVAEEKVLERCEVRFGEPCETVAIDLAMAARKAGAPVLHDMPRVSYSGDFDPGQIPAVRQLLAERPDIAGYTAAPEPKAVAIHPRGVVTVSTGAATQRQAEIQALRACNNDVNRDSDGDCFLYAVGNHVVLSQRRTTSISRP